uniref:Mating-type protein MAT-1 n=1 Tax=Passalora fulva TaxID=5499 RepID=Q0Q2I9_PASFU|nr:putative alpha1 mating-type protein [Fulvia fulva]
MDTNTMADDFRTFLEGCDEAMASQIIGVLQQAGRHIVSSTASGMTARRSAVAKTEKEQRKKTKSDPLALGPKRPLNSWMAFRSFYNAMLRGHTQKAISKALTILWRADPFEAKWAVLAKAYSVLRGCREKKDAPLDTFFVFCAPLIGVIPPEEYLQCMGWQMGPPLEGDLEKTPQLIRLFTPNLDTFPEKYTMTTLSVDDLVNHCYTLGYVVASNDGSPSASTHGSLTMVSKPTAITTNDMDETTHMTSFAQTNTTLAFTADTPSSSTNEGFQHGLFGQLADSPSSPTNNANPSPLEAAPASGQTALERATSGLAGVEYPYNDLFDPTSQFEVSFNPAAPNTAVEDDGRWDAFDPNTLMAQNEEGEMSFTPDEMLNVRWEDFINDDGLF